MTCVSPGLSPLPHQTSDAKQGETQHEELKRRWHFHRGTRDVDGHVGSSRQGHRANNQKHRKDEAYDVLHLDTSIDPRQIHRIRRAEGHPVRPECREM